MDFAVNFGNTRLSTNIFVPKKRFYVENTKQNLILNYQKLVSFDRACDTLELLLNSSGAAHFGLE